MAAAVTGDGDKVEGGVHIQRPRQIRQKRRCALQHADQNDFFAVQVTGNLRAQFGDALGNLLTGKENFKSLLEDGSHALSIA
jgi:hypothetical protein